MNNKSQTAVGETEAFGLKRLGGLCLAKSHHMISLQPDPNFLLQAVVVMTGH
jgi:hypothetical protein